MDILVIAGDIFDTTTPSNRAQSLYYKFLTRLGPTPCSHVVVIGGNHDSPSFLDAPASLLKALNVHVVGSAPPDMEDEILDLFDDQGRPLARICAVPYLRDRDIRRARVGEDADEKTQKFVRGIETHYEQMGQLAGADRVPEIPLIATGHLFAAGGKTVDGDGVRELYIGSLARVGANAFQGAFDYVALGHLHSAQKVGGCEEIRYSGAPLPMGFGEAGGLKKMIQVDFDGAVPTIETVEIPCFQELISIKGEMGEILEKIEGLVSQNSRAWLEVEYTGEGLAADLRQQVETAVADSAMEVRRIKNCRMVKKITQAPVDRLETMDETDVFQRLLEGAGIPDDEQSGLMVTYGEILKEMQEKDLRAQCRFYS